MIKDRTLEEWVLLLQRIFPMPIKNNRSFDFEKVNRGMKERGTPYQGILFAGLMIDGNGVESQVNVVEFNIRFGDPETQSLLPTLDEDIFEMLQHTAQGTLQTWDAESGKKYQTRKTARKSSSCCSCFQRISLLG